MAVEKDLDDMTLEDWAEIFAEEAPVDSPLEQSDDDDTESLFGEKRTPTTPAAERSHAKATAPVSGLALPPNPTTLAPQQSYAKSRAPFSGLALPPNPKVLTTPNPGQSVATPAKSNGSTIQATPVDVQKPAQLLTKRKRTDDKQEQPAKKQKQTAIKPNSQPATFSTPGWVKQAPGLSPPNKRKRTDDEPEQPAKKQKTTPDRFFYCRYGCEIHIKSRPNLKAHMEKVHNLWFEGESSHQCHCYKMFRDKSAYEKHGATCERGAFNHKDAWKVPPPRTLQEYADTWGMDIHGEMSKHLNVPVDDQGRAMKVRLSSELEVPPCEDANLHEVPRIEIARPIYTFDAAIAAQNVFPMVPVPRLTSMAPPPLPAVRSRQPSTYPVRSYQQVMRDMDEIINADVDFLTWIDVTPTWLRQWAHSLPTSGNSTGQTSGNPIVLN